MYYGRKERMKEGNILFNDTLNTFYLRLYGVGHTVKDHSDGERGNPLPLHGLDFPISSKGSFLSVCLPVCYLYANRCIFYIYETVGVHGDSYISLFFACSSVVRAFAHGAMGLRIDPSWWTN